MTDTPTTAKALRADAARALAASAVTEAIRLADTGNWADAEDIVVHAYHEGARAMDILDQYHTQRSAQEQEASR